MHFFVFKDNTLRKLKTISLLPDMCSLMKVASIRICPDDMRVLCRAVVHTMLFR